MLRFFKLGLLLTLMLYHHSGMSQYAMDLIALEQFKMNGKVDKMEVKRTLSLMYLIKEGIVHENIKSIEAKRFMGITHTPALDFNIYLTFANSITPGIRTAFEVSLNYSGVMNFKGQIMLRKKRRCSKVF